jgi:hypothetical protein
MFWAENNISRKRNRRMLEGRRGESRKKKINQKQC